MEKALEKAQAEAEFWKERVDVYRQELEAFGKVEDDSSLSDEAKDELSKKAKDMEYKLKDLAYEDKEGPKEKVTLESLGLHKGDNAEKKFQLLIDKGMSPEEAKEIFEDYPDMDSTHDDKDKNPDKKDDPKDPDKDGDKNGDTDGDNDGGDPPKDDKHGDKTTDKEDKPEGGKSEDEDPKKTKGEMGGVTDIISIMPKRKAF